MVLILRDGGEFDTHCKVQVLAHIVSFFALDVLQLGDIKRVCDVLQLGGNDVLQLGDNDVLQLGDSKSGSFIRAKLLKKYLKKYIKKPTNTFLVIRNY